MKNFKCFAIASLVYFLLSYGAFSQDNLGKPDSEDDVPSCCSRIFRSFLPFFSSATSEKLLPKRGNPEKFLGKGALPFDLAYTVVNFLPEGDAKSLMLCSRAERKAVLIYVAQQGGGSVQLINGLTYVVWDQSPFSGGIIHLFGKPSWPFILGNKACVASCGTLSSLEDPLKPSHLVRDSSLRMGRESGCNQELIKERLTRMIEGNGSVIERLRDDSGRFRSYLLQQLPLIAFYKLALWNIGDAREALAIGLAVGDYGVRRDLCLLERLALKQHWRAAGEQYVRALGGSSMDANLKKLMILAKSGFEPAQEECVRKGFAAQIEMRGSTRNLHILQQWAERGWGAAQKRLIAFLENGCMYGERDDRSTIEKYATQGWPAAIEWVNKHSRKRQD